MRMSCLRLRLNISYSFPLGSPDLEQYGRNLESALLVVQHTGQHEGCAAMHVLWVYPDAMFGHQKAHLVQASVQHGLVQRRLHQSLGRRQLQRLHHLRGLVSRQNVPGSPVRCCGDKATPPT